MASVTALGAMSTMCAEPHQESLAEELCDENGSEHYHQHYHVNDYQHYDHSQAGLSSDQQAQHFHHFHHHHNHGEGGSAESHLHHHLHYQSEHHHQSSTALHHTSSLASSSSSSSSSVGGEVTCCDESRYFATCRCSHRLLTTIVITILPIAITLTLIAVFMMQKTNLHQYAIYLFVTFSILFVFPFALFFFTVILNKIYKFYKREIRATPSPSSHLHHQMLGANCDFESGAHCGASACERQSSNAILMVHSGVEQSAQEQYRRPLSVASNASEHDHRSSSVAMNPAHLTMATTTTADGQTANMICYNSRAYPPQPYYYQTEDGTIVALAASEALHEESPPSYEMALLCPSVNAEHRFPPGTYPAAQVLLPTSKDGLVDCKDKTDFVRTPRTLPHDVSQSSTQHSDDSEDDNSPRKQSKFNQTSSDKPPSDCVADHDDHDDTGDENR